MRTFSDVIDRVFRAAETTNGFTNELMSIELLSEGYELSKGLVLESWIGLFAPAHTPQPVIEKLQAAVAKVMQNPDVLKRLETSGIRPISMAPKDTESFVKTESEKWAQFLRNAGIKAE